MIFTAGFWGPQSFSDFKAKNRHWRFITTISYKPAATTAGSDGRFTLFWAQYNWVIWAPPTVQSICLKEKPEPFKVSNLLEEGTRWGHMPWWRHWMKSPVRSPHSSKYQLRWHRFSKKFPKFPENCFVFLAAGRLVSYTHVSLLSGESSFDDYTITGV